MCVQHFAQTLVDADRASLFLLDYDNQELYARIFDVKIDNEIDDHWTPVRRMRKEIRFASKPE
jgi:hypothetical protein